MLRMNGLRAFLALAPVLLIAEGTLAQQAPPAPANGTAAGARAVQTGRPRVFFDCQGQTCDQNYYRTEITWVDWVRDAQDSHVHIIMTQQNVGGGGIEFVLDYIGRGSLVDVQFTDRLQSISTDTQRERLDAVAYSLAVGLARFADLAGFRNVYRIEPYEGDLGPQNITAPEGIVAPDEVNDPWNLWTFRINGNGNYSGESTRKSFSVSGGFNASRTTPTWKTTTGGSWNFNKSENQRSNGTWLIDERVNWSINSTIVYSIAEHWSVGIRGGPARQIQQNQLLRIQANPAIEFSYWPYEEATRRSLTAFYEIGPVYRNYEEVTIHGQKSEVLLENALTIEFSARQPWGNASVSANASSYMHDFSKHNLGLNGNISYRITRGINLNMNASVARVKDQIYLSGEELTEEERLLRIRAVGTDWQANASMGLSWQFGSIFNNVVNNRFPGGGGPGGGGGGPGGGGGGGGGGF